MTTKRGNVWLVVLVAFCVLLPLSWRWSVMHRRTEPVPVTPEQRAYIECIPCGLTDHEIDDLINGWREADATRSETLQAFRNTFDSDTQKHAHLCRECVAAVLDAAGVVE